MAGDPHMVFTWRRLCLTHETILSKLLIIVPMVNYLLSALCSPSWARPEAQKRHAAVKKLADDNAKRVKDIIRTYRKDKKSYQDIADEMNKLDIETARGGKWYGKTIQRYEQRI